MGESQGERGEGAEGVETQTQKKGGGPELWRPRRVGGPKGGGVQNFAFFFPSPAGKFVLFFPLWGSSHGILVVFEAPERSNVPGVSHDSPRAQTCTFEGLGLQNTTKIQREDTQRGKKRTNLAAGGKKRAKFWAVQAKGGPAEPSGGAVRRRAVRRVVRRRAVRTRGGPNRGEGVRWPKSVWPPKIGQVKAGGQIGPNWPGPTKIGLATPKNGPNRPV